MHRRIGVLLLLSLGLGACRLLPARGTPTPTPSLRSEEGPAVVSAEGRIVPLRRATLAFPVGGRLEAVRVEEGEVVQAGQELARLEASVLEAALTRAEASVAEARAALALLEAGPREEELEQARAAVAAARAALALLEAGPRAEELEQARAAVAAAQAELERRSSEMAQRKETARLAVDQAANALRNAQDAYERVYWDNRSWEEAGRELSDEQKDAETRALRAVQDAEAELEKARIAYREALRQEAAVLAAARAALEEAQARLALLEAGPRQEELDQARARLEGARAALEEARARLEQTRLRAPFSGRVGRIWVRAGEVLAPGQPVLDLGEAELGVETVDLSELDVVRVRVGQAVRIDVDALPDVPFRGEVIAVAPEAEEYRGDRVYRVKVRITEGPVERLRWGMTAFVEIQVEGGP